MESRRYGPCEGAVFVDHVHEGDGNCEHLEETHHRHDYVLGGSLVYHLSHVG